MQNALEAECVPFAPLAKDDFLRGGAAQKKWRKLEAAIAGVISSYDLVHFIPLSIKDKDTMAHTCRFIDKSNGFLYSGLKGQVDGDTCGLGASVRNSKRDR